MGNLLSNPGNSILRFIVTVIEVFTKPPAQPLDFSQPARIEQEPPEVLIERARKELGIDSVNDYNFAVVGASGVGKSSFVNGARLLEDSNKDAAPVGETECTTDIQKFPHPLLRHVVLWDLPGAGTPTHPSDTYFSDMKLYAFDCILILSSDRFLKVDFEVAKAALEYKTRCAFVRTKTDVAIKSIADRKELTALEASKELRKAVEASFREGLEFSGLSSKSQQLPLFFVSNRAFTDLNAYSILPESGDELDTSLEKMDEEKIYSFLSDSVMSRSIKISKTMSKTATMKAPALPTSTPAGA